MGKKRKRKKGHYCWVCGRLRPGSYFSRKGFMKHVCKQCVQREGWGRIPYLQEIRNLERCVTWDGFVRRKHRKQFERFLEHKDPEVRAHAKMIQARAEEAQEEWRRIREEFEPEEFDEFPPVLEEERDSDQFPNRFDEEIPF